jgi:hypothetical protein
MVAHEHRVLPPVVHIDTQQLLSAGSAMTPGSRVGGADGTI